MKVQDGLMTVSKGRIQNSCHLLTNSLVLNPNITLNGSEKHPQLETGSADLKWIKILLLHSLIVYFLGLHLMLLHQ